MIVQMFDEDRDFGLYNVNNQLFDDVLKDIPRSGTKSVLDGRQYEHLNVYIYEEMR